MSVTARAGRELRQLIDFFLHSEGSTRPVALMRMALVAIIWARWANELVVFRHLTNGQWAFCILFFCATTSAFFGLFTRVTMALTAACAWYLVYYVGHVTGNKSYTHHHTTLLAWASLLLALAPCGRSYSVDRWLAVARSGNDGEPLPERGNLWAQRLIALQVSSIYFWAALDKLNWGFLSGARMQHYVMYYYWGSTPLDAIPGLVPLLAVVAWGTVALELGLAFGMWSRRARRWLVIPGFLLHGVFYMALSVFTYTVTMWTLYLAFFDPDHVHRTLDRLSGAPSPN